VPSGKILTGRGNTNQSATQTVTQVKEEMMTASSLLSMDFEISRNRDSSVIETNLAVTILSRCQQHWRSSVGAQRFAFG
jgi:hypothetical protein